MLNMWVVRKWGGLMLSSLITVICFYIGTLYYGLMVGIASMVLGLIFGMLMGSLMLNNPFRKMLEGKGIMVFSLDSTGVIRPFIVGIQSPYIKGRFNKKPVNDVFDRSTVLNLATPKEVGKKAKVTDEGGVEIKLSNEDYNKGRFGFFHYPVLFWNDQIKSIITKDFLGDTEKQVFAEHGVLYLNRKMEELTSAVRDFGRHVVELTKPKESFWANKWVWVIVAVLVGILVFLFAPVLIDAISKVGITAGSGYEEAVNNAVTPR